MGLSEKSRLIDSTPQCAIMPDITFATQGTSWPLPILGELHIARPHGMECAD